jgi:hypothetical protein
MALGPQEEETSEAVCCEEAKRKKVRTKGKGAQIEQGYPSIAGDCGDDASL